MHNSATPVRWRSRVFGAVSCAHAKGEAYFPVIPFPGTTAPSDLAHGDDVLTVRGKRHRVDLARFG